MITGHGDSGTSMNPIRIAVPNITSSELTKQLVVTAIYVNKRRRILYCVAPGLQVTKTSFSWQEALSDVMLSSVFRLRDNVKLSSFTTDEQREILSTYFKFLFVQHPFERLVSTYKKKFGGVDVSSSEKLNPLLAAHIRLINQRYKVNKNNSHFINDSGAADYSANRSVTFQQMVRYVLDRRYLIPRPFGRLLYPYSDLCLPCVIRYDYIGHYETFDADIDYLRHSRLGIQTKVRQTDTVDRNLPVEVVAAFRSLSEAEVKRLSNEYQLDFELFGYENKMLT